MIHTPRHSDQNIAAGCWSSRAELSPCQPLLNNENVQVRTAQGARNGGKSLAYTARFGGQGYHHQRRRRR
eukprot:scaffold578123_cov33-Prasinocladus_malaysianus.AAC.1